MDSVIAGRVVVITGGSAGISRPAVELFARRGAHVVLAARGARRGQEVATQLQAEGCHVLFVQADVARSEDVERLISTTLESFGRIDCAFNNAAALAKIRRSAEYSEAEFDTEATLNFKGVWLCMKHENRGKEKAGSARRRDRQHFFCKRSQRRERCLALCNGEGWCARINQVCCSGVFQGRNSCERFGSGWF